VAGGVAPGTAGGTSALPDGPGFGERPSGGEEFALSVGVGVGVTEPLAVAGAARLGSSRSCQPTPRAPMRIAAAAAPPR
jgi:hypothetical protein